MSQDIENKKVEEVDEKVDDAMENLEDEDMDGVYDEEELIEAGYKAHKFSLFDSPIEIATIVFMIIFAVYSFIMFALDNRGGTEIVNIFNFLFDLVLKLAPGVILLVACEIHEKVELIEYNLSLNSEYMARYQMDLLEKMNKKDQ